MLTVKKKLIAPQNPSECIQKIEHILCTTAEVEEAFKAKKTGTYYRKKSTDSQKIVFDTVDISYSRGTLQSNRQATNTLHILPQYENSSMIDLKVNLGWEFIILLISSITNTLITPSILYFASGMVIFVILFPLVGLLPMIFFFIKRRKLVKNTLTFLKIEAGIKPEDQ